MITVMRPITVISFSITVISLSITVIVVKKTPPASCEAGGQSSQSNLCLELHADRGDQLLRDIVGICRAVRSRPEDIPWEEHAVD